MLSTLPLDPAFALSLGRRALEQLGIGRYEARERADRFRRLNLEMLEEMAAQSVDDTEFKYDACKRANALLTEIFNEDRAHPIDNWYGVNPHPKETPG